MGRKKQQDQAKHINEPHKGRRRKVNEDGTLAERNFKFTPAVAKEICDALRLGVPLTVAAAAVKLNPRTLHNWINQGLEGKTEALADFAYSVEQARAQFILDNLKTIRETAKGSKDRPGQWLPSAWLLERVIPGQPYAIQKHKIEVEDTTVKDVAITQAQQTAIEARVLELTHDPEPDTVQENRPEMPEEV
jgi:hypothetical protein